MDSASDAPQPDNDAANPPVMVTVATQTDKCDDDDICYDTCCDDDSPLMEVPLTELDFGAELDCEEDLNRTIDYEYEEVTLSRIGFNQKVGLTLCYGSACDEITDVYVGEVDPSGIAAKDGRIREGDQILQINGCDVHTRLEAIRLFSESKSTVTLLLARPAIQMDDGFMEIYNSLDDLRNKLDGAELHAGPTPSKRASNQDVSFADRSTSTEYRKLDRRSITLDKEERKSHEQILHEAGLALPKSLAQTSQKLGNCDRSPADFGVFHRQASHNEAAAIVDSDIDALNREMQSIQIQCQEILSAHRAASVLKEQLGDAAQADVLKSPRMVPRMGTRLEYVRQLHLASEQLNHVTVPPQVKTSPKRSATNGQRGLSEQDTSAYNTGESCRSTPAVAVESLRTVEDSLDPIRSIADKPNSCLLSAQTNGTRCSEDATKQAMVDRGVDSRTSQTPNHCVESLQALYNQYVDVMYTNKANLQHTIMVQQNLFQQQLVKNEAGKAQSSSSSKCEGPRRSATAPVAPLPSNDSAVLQLQREMEWVVKRRADGSRYITRRPIRNRILKERARKLAEERCGLTTDDDAISELKIGRYWSKEERKRHLEKARNHRRQKEMLIQQQMESNRDKLDVKKEFSAVELGHRKNMKHKSKKALDNFTTVQELLVHGSRDGPGRASSYNALLSVTTV